MTKDKKVTAAIAAVMSYLQDEEAVCAQAAISGMPQAPAATAVGIIKPWGMSGRQAQMQMRNLMQMRTFQRNRSL
ncbi:MAG: hypothetical protein V2I56_20490 [Desulfobacteraceae bacterium]|jgi:hypothetical protein|nr:hypothetical protein [Desulfobacteraceae bacterium]